MQFPLDNGIFHTYFLCNMNPATARSARTVDSFPSPDLGFRDGEREVCGSLDKRLLRLHRAETPATLWRAAESLALAITGSSAAMMTLNVIHFRPQHVWSTGNFHKRMRPETFLSLMTNPLVEEYFTRFPGDPVFAASRLYPNREAWLNSPFATNHLRPDGFGDMCAVAVQVDGKPRASLAVMRPADAPAFTETEFGRMRWLLPHFETACERVLQHAWNQAARIEMETRFGEFFNPGLLLDWNFRVMFCNKSAWTRLTDWGGSRAQNTRRGETCENLPPPLQETLTALRDEIESRLQRYEKLPPEESRTLPHPDLPGQQIVITALLRPMTLRGLPMFHLDFTETPADSRTVDPWQQLALKLTPAEMQILHLVCDGLTNTGISERLGKSLQTVKTQLSSVYRKAGVHGRAQLLALRPANGG